MWHEKTFIGKATAMYVREKVLFVKVKLIATVQTKQAATFPGIVPSNGLG